MRQPLQPVLGPKRLYPRKVKSWPPRTIVIEPLWASEEVKAGVYRLVAKGWWFEVLDSQLTLLNEGKFVEETEDLLYYIEALASTEEFVLVVGHGMDNILVLLGVSEHFYKRGYRAKNYFVVKTRCFAEIAASKRRIVFVDIRNWLHGDQCEFADWAGWPLKKLFRWWPDEVVPDGYHAGVVAAMVCGLQRYREWVRSNGLGDFSFSLSSMIFNHWTRQEESRLVRKAETSIHEQAEREGHHGGFCKAHRLGTFTEGPYYLLDANGLYGWILANHKLPYQHFTSAWTPEPHWYSMVEREGEALVCGRFEINAGWLPVNSGPFLQWEHGPLDAWLPWPEFKWILRYGKVHEVHALLVYKVAHITAATVGPLLQERFRAKAAGEKYESTLWKLAINSLYGKTAQRFGPVDVCEVPEGTEDGVEWIVDADTGRTVRIITWCGSQMAAMENGGGYSHFPKIAAWVTSWARVYLWEWCKTAGWQNVLYNDTDCLLVTSEGYERLKHLIADNQPGRLKVDAVSDTVTIHGRKQYEIAGRRIDNTEPNYYYLSEKGGLYWIEKDAMKSWEVRGDNQIILRKRHKSVWDSAERGFVTKEMGGDSSGANETT